MSAQKSPASSEDVELAPGYVVGTRQATSYRIGRILGRGSHANVYEVTDARGQSRALKVVHARFPSRGAVAARIANEAATMSMLRHPNILRVYATGETAGDHPQTYVEMEVLSGYEARKLVTDGPVAAPVAIDLLSSIAGALEEAHGKGVIHRDLTLDRVFVHYDASERLWVLKVRGFGAAYSLAEEVFNQLGTGEMFQGPFKPSVEYAAPEQLSASGEVTAKVDLYALGTIAFELPTRQRPYQDAERMDRELREILRSLGGGAPN